MLRLLSQSLLLVVTGLSVIVVGLAGSCTGTQRTEDAASQVRPEKESVLPPQYSPYGANQEAPHVTSAFTRRQIGSLDDPGNPYRNEYRDWDRWIFSHIDPRSSGTLGVWVTEDTEQMKKANPGEKITTLSTQVDEEGWLVPITESIQRSEDRVSEGERSKEDEIYWATAIGVMDSKLKSAFNTEADRVHATIYGVIPAWLVASHPDTVMFLPNDWIVCGRFQPSDLSDDCHCNQESGTGNSNPNALEHGPTVYTVKSRDGDVLYGPCGNWQVEVFKAHGIENLLGDPQFDVQIDKQYKVRRLDRMTGKTLAYDYDGTLLPAGEDATLHPQQRFVTLSFKVLQHLYDAQQK
jgi:hypothetical protein